jgi:hypothetical protein
MKSPYRESATQTINFMEKQLEFNQNVKITMNDMKNDIKNICVSIEENNKQNIEQHKEILKQVNQLRKWAFSVLVIFALATLYYIFAHVGLPKP